MIDSVKINAFFKIMDDTTQKQSPIHVSLNRVNNVQYFMPGRVRFMKTVLTLV